MRTNPVKTALGSGQVAFGTMVFEFFTPGLCQILHVAGASFVILDMEHSGVGIETIKAQIAFARGIGIVPMVRVPGCYYHLIATILDAGALGIMVPMVETVEQAEQIASWTRYRPEGVRGLAFSMAHDDYLGGDVVDKMQTANERIMAIALIETAKGIENAEAIMAVSGIDVGWLGHFDLTDSMGIAGQFDHPRFEAAVAHLISACNKAEKPAGFLAGNAEVARAWQARGFRMLCLGTDIALLKDTLAKAISESKIKG
ncbi:MAG: aldolase/citrate lyase family protein [Beijerinckiaceae bacterium]|nr:aldolase/citrate lyase family protein [Beijerinckiaceae bacterium]